MLERRLNYGRLIFTGAGLRPYPCRLSLMTRLKGDFMGIYLNPGVSNFKESRNTSLFVDKSMLIASLNKVLCSDSKYLCISRPRRFGKSMAANMIAAYYSKGRDSHEVFSDLKIAKDPSFEKYINKFNVIKIDINAIYSTKLESDSLMKALTKLVLNDLRSHYSDIKEIFEETTIPLAIQAIYARTNEQFIIIIDEYDLPIRIAEKESLLGEYLRFLNGLFKNADLSPAIALAYITGILPIVRDTVQSKLNNFDEYTMLNSMNLSEFVGFTEEETKDLCLENGMDFGEVKRWYNGYNLKGIEIYSPKSVVDAIRNKECDDYWTQTGSYEALKDYILMNFEGIKDDVVSMISGAKVPVNVLKYMNTMVDFHSKDDVFTYLIHLGYLAYDKAEKKCYIPNKEIRTEWINSIEDDKGYRNVMALVNSSRELLEATWDMDSEAVAEALEKTHMTVTSNLTYNNEGSFQSAIRLAYFYADSYYTVFSELPTGKGYADVAFIPFVKDKPAMIVELKRNKSVDTAIDQIKDKSYPAGLEKYKDNLLLVGISYDEKEKKHTCRIERA